MPVPGAIRRTSSCFFRNPARPRESPARGRTRCGTGSRAPTTPVAAGGLSRAPPYGAAMDQKLSANRQLCLDQAQSFIEAAERLGTGWPHIVYHLSLLALEEVGKAN